MKKLLLSLCIMLFVAGSLSAQIIAPEGSRTDLSKKTFKPTLIDPAAKYIFSDTIEYVWMKYVSNSGIYLTNAGTSIISASQYFTCPQTVTVKGFIFYADAETVPTMNALCEIYAATAAHLPTGAALGTATVAVDSLDANGYRCVAMFGTPVVMNAAYCLVVTNNSAPNLVYFSTADGNGQGEDLSGGKFGTTWYSVLGGFGYDQDWLVEPIVSYDIADVYFTKDHSCLVTGNELVTFDMTASAIYSDPMYNYMAYADSIKYQFEWNFGDATPLQNAMDTTHNYVSMGLYTITLYDTYIGWYFYITRDTTATIDACVGMDENSSNNFRIFPNPANNVLNVVDAENATIEIFSMVGSKVKRIENASKNESIDMSNLSEGSYFVRITNGESVVTRKISVLR